MNFLHLRSFKEKEVLLTDDEISTVMSLVMQHPFYCFSRELNFFSYIHRTGIKSKKDKTDWLFGMLDFFENDFCITANKFEKITDDDVLEKTFDEIDNLTDKIRTELNKIYNRIFGVKNEYIEDISMILKAIERFNKTDTYKSVFE